VKRGRHSVLIANGVPPTLHPNWAVRRLIAHGRYFTLRIDTHCDLGVALQSALPACDAPNARGDAHVQVLDGSDPSVQRRIGEVRGHLPCPSSSRRSAARPLL